MPPRLSNSNRTLDQTCHVNDPSERSELKRLEVLLINSSRMFSKLRRLNLFISTQWTQFWLNLLQMRMFPFMSEIIPAYFELIRQILSYTLSDCQSPQKLNITWVANLKSMHLSIIRKLCKLWKLRLFVTVSEDLKSYNRTFVHRFQIEKYNLLANGWNWGVTLSISGNWTFRGFEPHRVT